MSYWACFKDDVKLIFAAPQKLLVIEDLAVSLELDDLKKIFNETIKHFFELAKESSFEPALNVPEFYILIKDIPKEMFAVNLYDKKCQYSASVVRKIHKIYNNNMVVADNDLANHVFRHVYLLILNYRIDEDTPDFTKIYRNEEFYKNLENIEPTEESLKIILEKIAILCHLVDRNFRNYIDQNVNPLKRLFAKKFDKFDDNYVINLFNQINVEYSKKLEMVFYEDIKRVAETPFVGRNLLRNCKN